MFVHSCNCVTHTHVSTIHVLSVWRSQVTHVNNPLHRYGIPIEILSKMELFRPHPATPHSVEPFEIRALFISQCPHTFSSFLDLRRLLTGSDCFHVIPDCFDSFFRDLHTFWNCPPPKYDKLSKILWKIWKFWKRISADQIHSGGEGKSRHPF